METKVEWWFRGTGERDNRELVLKSYRVSVWVEEKVPEMEGGECTL